MKAFKLKTLALFITGLMVLTTVSAVEPSPQKSMDAESPNIDTTEGQTLTTFDKFVNSLSFLSALSGADQVNPGSDITFDSNVDATETFNIGDKVKVVEIYKCQDSTCDNGEFVEATSDFIAFDATLNEGATYSWSTTYTTPTTPEGYYVATSYISDGSGNVFTDSPEHKFIVGSVPDSEKPDDGTDDGSNDGTDDGTDGGSDGSTGDGTDSTDQQVTFTPEEVGIGLLVLIIIGGGVYWITEN